MTTEQARTLPGPSPGGRPPGRTTLALPPVPPFLTGRDGVLAEVTRLLCPDTPVEGARVVAVTSAGRVGTGTSAIAIRAAHGLRSRYPGGVLYVDLGGERPDPHNQLCDLLLSYGIARSAIPDEPAERAMLHRAELAARRTLLVLDNVASSAAVAPLLPGIGTGAAIIAGCHPLQELPGASLSVGVLARDDSATMLRRLLGPVSITQETVETIVASCEGVPLAIRLAAGCLSGGTSTRAAIAEQLRLAALDGGKDVTAAAARCAVTALEPGRVGMLRLLSDVGLPGLPLWGAAAAVGGNPAEAEESIRILARTGLLDTIGQDLDGQPRLRVRPLIVNVLSEVGNGQRRRRQHSALERLGLTYLRAVEHSAGALAPGLVPVLTKRPRTPKLLPEVERIAALSQTPARWFALEHRSVLALIQKLHDECLDELTVLLSSAAVEFFELGPHWNDWERCSKLALTSARRCGWRLGEANALRNLGRLEYYRAGPLDRASERLSAARAIFLECGDQIGAACCGRHLGVVAAQLGRPEDALRLLTNSLHEFEILGRRNAIARTEVPLGDVLRTLNRLDESEQMLRQAISTFEGLGNDLRAWRTRSSLAMTCQAAGRPQEAIGLLIESVRALRRHGDVPYEAEALLTLGELYNRSGRAAEAAIVRREASAMVGSGGDEPHVIRMLAGRPAPRRTPPLPDHQPA